MSDHKCSTCGHWSECESCGECHWCNDKLQAEVDMLRKENQELRLQLITALVPDGYEENDEPLTVPRYYGHDAGISRLAWRIDRLEKAMQELRDEIHKRAEEDGDVQGV